MDRSDEHNAKIGAALRSRGAGQTPTKVCPRCREEKDRATEFGVRPNGNTESYCIPCAREYSAERQRAYHARKAAEDPEWTEKRRAGNRATVFRIKYGITLEDYASLLEAQGGVCAVCSAPPPTTGKKRYLCVDHDHGTGAVRGLLCDTCNRALGLLGDSPEVLLAAVEYLRVHQSS